MSNYPPPPTFGVPFNPNGHAESPVGSRDHGLPHHSHPYQNPPFLYGQGQPNGMSLVPLANSNTHFFRSNAQGVTTPSSGNEANGAPDTHYGGQVQYSAFQTPTYPSMPSAHDAPSYGARSFSRPSTNPDLPPNSSAGFSNLQLAAEVQNTNIGDSDAVPPASSELEDGELDDEEAGKATGRSRESTANPSEVLQHKRHENVNSADNKSGHRVKDAPNRPLPGLIQGSLSTHSPQDSTASRPQMYPIPNGFVDNSDDPPFSRTVEGTSVQHQISTNTTKQGSKEANQQLIDQKMEEAKQALRDLHSQGFDFDQIVNAGLNPGVLRNLYNEIEKPVRASSYSPQHNIMKNGIVKMPTGSAKGVITGSTHHQHPESRQKDSNGDTLGHDTLPHLVTEEVKINSQSTLTAAKNEAKSIQSQASLAKSSKSTSVHPLGKGSGIKAGETKILDRKEYIARMLAAKAGKPAISATVPVSSETPIITDLGASTQARSSATTAATVPATLSQAPSELTNTAPGSQKEDSGAEAKRKAQTDLARQKIEALKLRESFQQQLRSANSSDVVANSQSTPAKRVPNTLAERSSSTAQPLPSRQSSYFSPASQKPPFSIPGLFMTSDTLEPANALQPPSNEGSAVSSQRIVYATFGSSQESLRPLAAISAQSPSMDKTSISPETSLDLGPAPPAAIPSTTSFNRKRQKASDFIDSPSTKIKRPLGQQENTSVIIDISDDEVSNDTSGDESLHAAGRRDSLPAKSQVIASGNSKENSIKNLPPLTDFPQRKKSVIMTPPAAQASGQNGDLKGLKSKEMEIEVMNRKIAELEQRIASKARQTTSRNHSPGTSSRVTNSPSPGEASHQINSAPSLPLNVSNSQNGDVARVENRESFTALAETNVTAAEEQLNAEQQLEEVERAKAEAERSLAAEITLASAAHHERTRDESIQIPQSKEQPNLLEGELRSKHEEQTRVHVEQERRLEESQSQEARREETKKFRQQEADRHHQEQEQRLAQGVRQERLKEQERKRSLNDQRQARKFEIESGLPLLDAEVERTRERLESLRQEMASLETQLQKEIECRQGLIEELDKLLQSREALPGPMGFDSCDVGDIPKLSPNTEETPAVTKISASAEMVPNFDPIQFGKGRAMQTKSSSARATDDRVSDGELEEDIMDISRSDNDEAGLSFYSPKAANEVQDTSGFIDDDENYEPPSEISIIQRQEQDHDVVVLSQDLEAAEADRPAKKQNQSSTDQYGEQIEKPTSGDSSPAASVNRAGDEQSRRSLSQSASVANASDLDDYEPPEPAPLGEQLPRSTIMPSVASEKSFPPRDFESNSFDAHASSVPISAVHQQVQKVESKCKIGHFTPYESPLKQFKSFRYHPRYLEEVSNGFRSLTYSHTINPDIPLCRYELDGVCNDDSCKSQHLRSVGLSDDKILVDLGAKPDDGSSPDEFGNGLREIIHDIRSRRIRDFNIVAGEITAYRARYLGDNSKVLPL